MNMRNVRLSIHTRLLVSLLAGLSVVRVQGAYLDDGTGAPVTSEREIASPEHWPIPIPIPIPIPPPNPDNPLRRMVRQIEIGTPFAYGRLTVFPLEIAHPIDPPAICSLDEALNRGWMTIREHEEARVSSVVVRNESRQTIFMMAGEILGGGRQDRILQQDVLLTPGMGAISVPVYCGEQDRWKGDTESFKHAPAMAGHAMRRLASRRESQEAIWTVIDEQLKQSGVEAPTRSYQSLYRDAETGRIIADRVEHFRRVRTRRTVGLVIVNGGRVVSADLFGDANLCAALWDKIIRSHVADTPLKDDWRVEREMVYDRPAAAVRRLLERWSRADLSRQATPGAGQAYAIGGGEEGQVLVWGWGGGLVHAAVLAPGGYRVPNIR